MKAFRNCKHCGLGEEFAGDINSLLECESCKPLADLITEDDVDFSILDSDIAPEPWSISGMYKQFKRKD